MSDPDADETRHWRRHDCYIIDVTGCRATATACGRIVPYDEVKGDPSEADCSECAVIATALGEEMFPEVERREKLNPHPGAQERFMNERPGKLWDAKLGCFVERSEKSYEAALESKSPEVRRQLLEGEWYVDDEGNIAKKVGRSDYCVKCCKIVDGEEHRKFCPRGP